MSQATISRSPFISSGHMFLSSSTGWMAARLRYLTHHFSSMAPGQILKSPDNLNPQVTSGPFLMVESVPGEPLTHWCAIPTTTWPARDYPTWIKWFSASSLDRTPSQGLYRLNTIDSIDGRSGCELRCKTTDVSTVIHSSLHPLEVNFELVVLQLPQHGAGQPPGSAPGDSDGDRSSGLDRVRKGTLQGVAIHNVPIIARSTIPAMILMPLVRSLIQRLPINCWMITAG